jgi:hypothetical protein
MAYGDDITEGIPYTLSNPVGATTYSANAESYDIAINEMPFFLNTGDEFPYSRQTSQYRKQQIDQSNEPGEQSITGWWVRAQSSFHNGTGIKFYDPSVGESVSYRFADSKGVDVWEKGKVTLLKDVVNTHVTTGAIAGTDHQHPNQHVRSIQWSNTEGVLLHDEFDVDKISAAGTVTHFIDYISGTDRKVFAICDDGVNAYWITNKTSGGNQRLTMFKKPLTGDSTTGSSNPSATGDVTQMFQSGDIEIQYATMEFVKDRIVLCVNNRVYELSTSASSLPSPVYTNPNTNYHYTSVAASGPAIYTAGHSGIYSTIQKYTLSTAGVMPTLTSAVVAAELPAGEFVEKLYYYLGYMMIGTNKGIRVAAINDQDGSLSYGPLILETSQPVYDFAARDHYVWASTGIGALDGGLTRLDLSNELEPLRFAYANDLQISQSTEHYTTGVAFLGTTNRLVFCTAHNTTDGAIYLESTSALVSSGYITTGKIRYGTLENKVFKILKPRIDNTNGGLSIKSIDIAGIEYGIGTFSQGDFTPEVSVNYPVGAQEYVSFKFEISRSSTNSANGPILSGYQLKSLPAVSRQRLITYPLACYDREKDSFGNQVGHEGAAYEKLVMLETVESVGDTIRVEDFRTGESYLGIIEQLQFINRTPSDKRFSGFGGILVATIRTI